MMKTFARRRAVLSLLLAAALGAGCATSLPRIAEVKTHPARYQEKTVRVEGVVTNAWAIPLLPIKLYRIDDGTGELTVLSNGARTPSRGDRVRVTGRLEDVAVLGGQAVGLHVREQSLSFVGS
jgi:hypothetical protein